VDNVNATKTKQSKDKQYHLVWGIFHRKNGFIDNIASCTYKKEPCLVGTDDDVRTKHKFSLSLKNHACKLALECFNHTCSCCRSSKKNIPTFDNVADVKMRIRLRKLWLECYESCRLYEHRYQCISDECMKDYRKKPNVTSVKFREVDCNDYCE
jgi:hypothetical protein